MTASKTQLTGGVFQDSEGNALALGYLLFKLNQDNSVSGVGNICAGIEVEINLNSSGSVDTTSPQYIWATDVMTVPNAFYTVTGYTAQGQMAWGPNNQQVTSGGVGGGTFDCGTWVPNAVFSWTPPVQPIVLQTNGTNNESQIKLNIAAGTGISISESGGTVTIANTGAYAPAVGMNIIVCPMAPLGGTGGNADKSVFGDSSQWSNWNPGAFGPSINFSCPASTILTPCTTWKCSIYQGSAVANLSFKMQIVKCLPSTLTVVAFANVTFGGQAQPNFTSAAGTIHTSDTINFPINPAYDYYFVCDQVTGQPYIGAPSSGQVGATGLIYVSSADNYGIGIGGTLGMTGGGSEPYSLLVNWVAQS